LIPISLRLSNNHPYVREGRAEREIRGRGERERRREKRREERGEGEESKERMERK
jgi:hypothetical protein